MAMAERRDGDPAREIEKSLPVGGVEPSPLPALERQLRSRIGVHQRRRPGAASGRRIGGRDLGLHLGRVVHRQLLLKSNSAGAMARRERTQNAGNRRRLLGARRTQGQSTSQATAKEAAHFYFN